MEVAKAVRISSCIPLYFEPVKHENKYYVDGGVLRNLPSDAFPETHPILLDFEDSNMNEITNLNTFTSGVINTMLGNVCRAPLGECIHVIIPTGHISATDFDIDDDDKKILYYSGYASTKNAFRHNEINDK